MSIFHELQNRNCTYWQGCYWCLLNGTQELLPWVRSVKLRFYCLLVLDWLCESCRQRKQDRNRLGWSPSGRKNPVPRQRPQFKKAYFQTGPNTGVYMGLANIKSLKASALGLKLHLWDLRKHFLQSKQELYSWKMSLEPPYETF